MSSSYRIEVSPNNRAGCQDSFCKATAAKCLKGELRFGTWTEIKEHGSWRWKHWGCVSGQQMQRLHEMAITGDKFDGDVIDGWDELDDYPDLQTKIREAVKRGHIAPEDFNGDPEYNTPGQRAIRARKALQDAKKQLITEDSDQIDDESDKAPAKGKKRARKSAAGDEDEDAQDNKPKKRTKKSAVKPGMDEEERDEEEAKPKLKSKAKGKQGNAVKAEDEEDELDVKPKVKGRRGMVKTEEDETEKPQPKKKRARTIKKEHSDEEDEEEDEEVTKPTKPTKRAAAARKASVKAELGDDEEEEKKPAPKKAASAKTSRAGVVKGRKTKLATEEEDGEEEAEAVPEPQQTAKRGRKPKPKAEAAADDEPVAEKPKRRSRRSVA